MQKIIGLFLICFYVLSNAFGQKIYKEVYDVYSTTTKGVTEFLKVGTRDIIYSSSKNPKEITLQIINSDQQDIKKRFLVGNKKTIVRFPNEKANYILESESDGYYIKCTNPDKTTQTFTNDIRISGKRLGNYMCYMCGSPPNGGMHEYLSIYRGYNGRLKVKYRQQDKDGEMIDLEYESVEYKDTMTQTDIEKMVLTFPNSSQKYTFTYIPPMMSAADYYFGVPMYYLDCPDGQRKVFTWTDKENINYDF